MKIRILFSIFVLIASFFKTSIAQEVQQTANKITSSLPNRVLGYYNPYVHKRNSCWDEASRFHGVDAWLLFSIASVESGFNYKAVGVNKNSSIDYGVMQINWRTWSKIMKEHSINKNLVNDPCSSIYMGAFILKKQIEKYGYTKYAVGAYNSRTPSKNKRYYTKVERAYGKLTRKREFYKEYRAHGTLSAGTTKVDKTVSSMANERSITQTMGILE